MKCFREKEESAENVNNIHTVTFAVLTHATTLWSKNSLCLNIKYRKRMKDPVEVISWKTNWGLILWGFYLFLFLKDYVQL